MILEIKINCEDPFFIQTVSIENKAYQFEFIWNDRDERWRMSILDMQDNYFIKNIKIMPLVAMVRRYKIQGLFSGDLLGYNEKNIFEIPTRDNLGKDFKLYYYSLSTIKEIKESNKT